MDKKTRNSGDFDSFLGGRGFFPDREDGMKRKKAGTMEFRFYEVPQNEYVLALLGERWIRDYGKDERALHFHDHDGAPGGDDDPFVQDDFGYAHAQYGMGFYASCRRYHRRGQVDIGNNIRNSKTGGGRLLPVFL